jgi:hypothetical protein
LLTEQYTLAGLKNGQSLRPIKEKFLTQKRKADTGTLLPFSIAVNPEQKTVYRIPIGAAPGCVHPPSGKAFMESGEWE